MLLEKAGGFGSGLELASGFIIALCVPAVLAAAPNDSPVADAAMRGDIERVRALLRQGADVNATQGDGMTALHWAAREGEVELAQMLIYAGADVEAGTRNGEYRPLHLASMSGATPVIAALLEAGADPDAATTAGGARPLHFAAAAGSADAVELLVNRGAAVDAKDTAWGRTPLMFAAAYNRVAAIDALTRADADTSIATRVVDVAAWDETDREAKRRRDERLAVLKALEEGTELPRTQAEQQSDGEEAEESEGEQAEAEKPEGEQAEAEPVETGQQAEGGEQAPGQQQEESAGEQKQVEGAQQQGGEQQQEGEEQQQEGEEQQQPGEQPTEGAQADEGEQAQEAGGNKPVGEEEELERPEGKRLSYAELVGTHGGLTALLYAAREGHVETVLRLLDAGADIDLVSAGDQTSPLLISIINGHYDLAMLLLERGADPTLAAVSGATPLYAALDVRWAPKSSYPTQNAFKQQETTHLEVMQALLEAGADPNVRLNKHLWYGSYNFDHLVDATGATPFWRAAYATDVDAMRLLVAHGADPSIATRKLPERRRRRNADAEEEEQDPSGLPPVPVGGPAVYPLHAASGAGYGEQFAANSHRHAPDGWLPAVKYLVEELGADVNARDLNGYTPLHHAAARGDNELVLYLVWKGADVTAVSRKGQTVADMANGPVQRVQPFASTVALLEKLGSRNSHTCVSC